MKTKMPKAVWVLDGEDFCRGIQQGGTCCLIGWASVVFLGIEQPQTSDFSRLPAPVKEALVQAVQTVSGQSQLPVSEASVYGFNDRGFYDDNRTTQHKTALARVWNLAMAKLGYTVGNPEAKRKKK
jgi:hypothetical protein